MLQEKYPAARRRSTALRRALPLAVAAVTLTASAAAWAFIRPGAPAAPPSRPQEQAAGQSQRRNPSLRPEAYAAARRLGSRFLRPGREVSVATGTLLLGSRRLRVRVVRAQDEAGERVEIRVAEPDGAYSWSAPEGARAGAASASGEGLDVVERIVYGGPDQFVLAQLRGAGYYTQLRRARPQGAGDSDDYAGPVWDLVRVTEPPGGGRGEEGAGRSRLYHVNSITGLVERVSWEERGEELVAEVSGWAERGGEASPSRVVWKRGGAVVMELDFDGHSYGPRR